MPSLRALQPVLAVHLAACVLLLGLAAVSPRLHDLLCEHAHDVAAPSAVGDADHETEPAADTGDHACAVALFAAGCSATAPHASVAPPSALTAARVAAFIEIVLSRTLRGPERVCGPPARA